GRPCCCGPKPPVQTARTVQHKLGACIFLDYLSIMSRGDVPVKNEPPKPIVVMKSSILSCRNRPLPGTPFALVFCLIFKASSPIVSVAADGKAATSSQLPPQLLEFSAAKEKQAQKLAERLDLKVSPGIWDYFKAAKQGDWLAVSNSFERLKRRSSQYEGSTDDQTVGTPVWSTIIEIQTAYEAFALGEPKYAFAFG